MKNIDCYMIATSASDILEKFDSFTRFDSIEDANLVLVSNGVYTVYHVKISIEEC